MVVAGLGLGLLGLLAVSHLVSARRQLLLVSSDLRASRHALTSRSLSDSAGNIAAGTLVDAPRSRRRRRTGTLVVLTRRDL